MTYSPESMLADVKTAQTHVQTIQDQMQVVFGKMVTVNDMVHTEDTATAGMSQALVRLQDAQSHFMNSVSQHSQNLTDQSAALRELVSDMGSAKT